MGDRLRQLSPVVGSLASAGRGDRALLMWDLGNGPPSMGPDGPEAISLAFSPDGRRLATTDGREHSVRIWDAGTGRWLRRLGEHAAPIRSAAFSPDGRLLTTGAGDGTAAIWSVATGRELRCLDARTDLLRRVAFSPDGRLLAASGNDGDIRLWDLDSLISGTTATAIGGDEVGRSHPPAPTGETARFDH